MSEIRVVDEDVGGNHPAGTDNPAAAREEIAHTRARMSDTIEEIEHVLVRKKGEVQDKLDVFSPIRERPLPSLGAAFGTGLLLGVVTGGSDGEEHGSSHRHRTHTTPRGDGGDRAEHWEGRSRRLLAIAQEQEDEIRDLEERLGALRADAMDHRLTAAESRAAEGRDGEPDDLRSGVGSLRGAIVGGITGFLSDTLHHLTESHAESRR